ncbi:MAG: type I-E CRISPR-associated protein Cse1/CasA [Phycisphaerae bacterium]|nr:type I-E CRISPR-associated protein Cse1/CasA [Phycisphaerae bacterium]
MPSFSLVSSPWISVTLIDGQSRVCSLKELLADAHAIARIGESSPLINVAMLRFLIALVSDGLRDRVGCEEDLIRLTARTETGLQSDAVAAIIAPLETATARDGGSQASYFDAEVIKNIPGWDAPNTPQSASQLLAEIPSGTNIVHFNHAYDADPPLCVGCMLKGRLAESAFARGGLGPAISRNLLSTIGGSEPRYVIPYADTLLKTLLLNLIVGDRGRPSWVAIHGRADGVPGPVARMTWRPRLVTPVSNSQSDEPCCHCGESHFDRFTKVVVADTYNHANSPYGAKQDVEQWKSSPDDPHLIPSNKDTFNLGGDFEFWPVRAITRWLTEPGRVGWNRMIKRAHHLKSDISVVVTSSAGNQAKIDDAPIAEYAIPSKLMAQPSVKLDATAEALVKFFDKEHAAKRRQLSLAQVLDTWVAIATDDDPNAYLSQWASETKPNEDDKYGVRSVDTAEVNTILYAAARALVKQMESLPDLQRQAWSMTNVTAGAATMERQAAMTFVWQQSRIESGHRRHALREAVAAILPIYSAHHVQAWKHEPVPGATFRTLANQQVAEDRQGGVRGGGRFRRLLAEVVTAPHAARQGALSRLFSAITETPTTPQPPRIDFADLLVELSKWHDPIDPTPARWRTILA